MRLWYEVAIDKTTISHDYCKAKWYPYCKGGPFRRWYGNRDYLVNWENDGAEIRNITIKGEPVKSSNYNTDYNLLPNIAWSDISTGLFAARFTPEGSLFDIPSASGS